MQLIQTLKICFKDAIALLPYDAIFHARAMHSGSGSIMRPCCCCVLLFIKAEESELDLELQGHGERNQRNACFSCLRNDP